MQLNQTPIAVSFETYASSILLGIMLVPFSTLYNHILTLVRPGVDFTNVAYHF